MMAIKQRIKFKETLAQKIAQQQDSGIYGATYDFLASPNYKEKKKNGKEKKRQEKKYLKEILIQELLDGDIQMSRLINLDGQTMEEY